MDNFLSQLTLTIQETVMKALSAKIQSFALALSTASDGKFTVEEVMQVWNTMHPEAPVSLGSAVAPVAKSPTQRTKTDKTRKCEVKKTAGADKGNACGKNCVEGKDTCVAHSPKSSTSSSTPSSPASSEAIPDLSSSTSEETVSKLKVPQLQAVLRSMGLSFASKDRKPALVDKVMEALRSGKTSTTGSSSPVSKSVETKPVETKTLSKSLPKPVEVKSVEAKSTTIGSDDALKKMTVVELKSLLTTLGIEFSSKDRKDALIDHLVKKRDAVASSPKVEEKTKEAEVDEEEVIEEVEDQEDEFEEEIEEVEEEEVEEVEEVEDVDE